MTRRSAALGIAAILAATAHYGVSGRMEGTKRMDPKPQPSDAEIARRKQKAEEKRARKKARNLKGK